MRSSDEAAEGGLDAQRLADAVVVGKLPGCGDTVTRGRAVFVCIRPIHEGPQPSVDRWRRAHGEPVATDRHYYVREGDQ